MAKLFKPNSFDSVVDMQKKLRVTLPKPDVWRLLSPALIGEVNALPDSRGVAVATNGILVLILQNEKIFFGHFDWFVVDQDETLKHVAASKEKKQHATKQPRVDISEFV